MPNKNRTSRVLSVRHARNDERVAKPQKADSCAPAQEKRRIVRIEKKKEKFVSTFRKRLGSLWWQILLPRSIQQSSSNKLFHNKNWERTLRSRFHKKRKDSSVSVYSLGPMWGAEAKAQTSDLLLVKIEVSWTPTLNKLNHAESFPTIDLFRPKSWSQFGPNEPQISGFRGFSPYGWCFGVAKKNSSLS